MRSLVHYLILRQNFCWKFIWRYQWKRLIWIIWAEHNKLFPWKFWCPNTWKHHWSENTLAFQHLHQIKNYQNAVVSKKKAILQCFQLVYLEVWRLKKLTDKFKVIEFTSKHSLGLNQQNLIIMLHQHWKNIVIMLPSNLLALTIS